MSSFHASFHQGDSPMAEINMIPMIDIMLVLLIVFMITAPLLTHAVKLDLPKASSELSQPEPRTVMLSIDARRNCYLNGVAIEPAALRQKLAQLGGEAEPPAIQLYVDSAVPYAELATLLAKAAQYGLKKVSFVMTPETATP